MSFSRTDKFYSNTQYEESHTELVEEGLTI